MKTEDRRLRIEDGGNGEKVPPLCTGLRVPLAWARRVKAPVDWAHSKACGAGGGAAWWRDFGGYLRLIALNYAYFGTIFVLGVRKSMTLGGVIFGAVGEDVITPFNIF